MKYEWNYQKGGTEPQPRNCFYTNTYSPTDQEIFMRSEKLIYLFENLTEKKKNKRRRVFKRRN